MSDVSCQVFEFFERGCPEYGLDFAWLIEGTTLTLESLRDPRQRVPWDDWAVICTRFEEAIGPDENRRYSRGIAQHDYNQPWARVAGTLLEPAWAYKAGLSWVGTSLFRNLRIEVEVLSGNRARAVITIPEANRGCVAWLRMAQGSMEALPLLLGLEAAAVNVTLTPHRGEYEIICPPSRSLLARFQRRLKATIASGAIVGEFDALQRDLRQAYDESQAAEWELRQVFDALPTPVAILRDDRIVHRNGAWVELLGHAVDSLSALVVSGSPDPERASTCTLRRVNGEVCFAELQRRVGLRWENLPATLLVARDRTEERRESEQRVVQNRLSSLGTLASVVGHELNNPLAYAMSILELAEQEVEHVDQAQLRARIREASSGLAKVARIARDLHTFARSGGASTAVHLDEVVHSALRIAGNQIRHSATLHTELAAIPPFAGDPGRLSQVVLNLVVNALWAVQDQADPQLVVRTRLIGGSVALEVQDNGCGISAADQDRIFDPFFTTHPGEGSGLGLAVCRTLVEEHGGVLTFESGPGGTTFRATLPLRPLAPAPALEPASEQPLHLLVVEDDEALADLYPHLLAPSTTRVCTDPRDALEVATREAFDAVVCDVMMPHLSGPELIEALRERLPELAERVLFVTGGTFGKETDLGDRAVLYKPFSRSDLRVAVSQVIDREASRSDPG